MDVEQLCWLPLEELAPLIAAGQVSPVALTEATLARIISSHHSITAPSR